MKLKECCSSSGSNFYSILICFYLFYTEKLTYWEYTQDMYILLRAWIGKLKTNSSHYSFLRLVERHSILNDSVD